MKFCLLVLLSIHSYGRAVAATANQPEGSVLEKETSGTYLGGARPYPHKQAWAVEFPDGTIFDLFNLPPGFDSHGLVSGRTSIAVPAGTEIFSDGSADMKGKAPQILNRRLERRDLDEKSHAIKEHDRLHRQMAVHEGDRTLLAVRVIASDARTTQSKTLLSNSIFGNGVDPVNLVSQMKACSYGKLNITKAANRSGDANGKKVSISNGVVTVRIPSISTAQGDGTMRNAITKELNEIFGVTHPTQLADHVMYCLPENTMEGIAYAYINSWGQVYSNEWCTYVSLQMHEMGHSLNFGHSNENGTMYEDETGAMGYSYNSNDAPKTCFNGAKSWQSGWYADKSKTIKSNGGRKCFNGELHGIADYPIANTVLLKVKNRSATDYYVNFNAKRGINSGTQEAGDQVTVTTRNRGFRDSYSESELVAELGSGESYSFPGYIINVGTINKLAGTAQVTVLPTDQSICEGPT